MKKRSIIALIISLTVFFNLLLSACNGKTLQNTSTAVPGETTGSLTATEPPTEPPAETQAQTALATDILATEKTDAALTTDPAAEPTPLITDEPSPAPSQKPTAVPTQKPAPDTEDISASVKFSEMEYVRPDAGAFKNAADRLTEAVESGSAGVNQLIKNLTDFFSTEIVEWNSMGSIANIRFSIDTSDPAWAEEMSYFDANNSMVEREIEELLVACAASSHRSRFEKELFGEGMLEPYVNGPVLTDEIVELMKQESELVSAYQAYDYTKQRISVGARYATIEEFLNDPSVWEDENQYGIVMAEIYKQIGKDTGSIYVDLVRIRKEIASRAGYDSYEDFAFDYSLTRDYTPEDALRFCDAIRDQLLPAMVEMVVRTDLYDKFYAAAENAGQASYGAVTEAIGKAVADMSDDMAEAYRFMEENELLHIGYDSAQAGASFTSYIQKYSSPYILIAGSGDYRDFLTLAHEFGHFYDNYKNLGSDMNLDTAEIASTALVFLMASHLGSAGLTDAQREAFVTGMKSDLITLFIEQAMYYKFEQRVYMLPDNLLTPANVGLIASQVAEEFGLDTTFGLSWPLVAHFFLEPFYVISYATAASASLQFYSLELDNAGSGLAKYIEYINSFDPSVTFTQMLENEGFVSPFTQEGIEELVRIIGKL